MFKGAVYQRSHHVLRSSLPKVPPCLKEQSTKASSCLKEKSIKVPTCLTLLRVALIFKYQHTNTHQHPSTLTQHSHNTHTTLTHTVTHTHHYKLTHHSLENILCISPNSSGQETGCWKLPQNIKKFSIKNGCSSIQYILFFL